jgi:uncharacterized protein (DUF1330 family)
MERTNEVLIGVHVIDETGYARYRAELAPLLEAHGGRFILDVRVAEILRAPSPTAFNRLFAIRFPSARHHDAFFADPDYVALRSRLFEPNVSDMVRLGDYSLRDESGVVSAR